VGVDTGGTFTDFVFAAGGRLQIFKIADGDPSIAIIDGLRRIAEMTHSKLQDLEVVHGTTVGTNALLQRRGARAALVTTKGFEDVLAIGRQARPELYNLDAVKAPPLVPDNLRFGVRERVSAQGEILETLDTVEVEKLVKKLQKARVESIAICLLFSFVRPEHERRIAEALAPLGVPLSLSQTILPEYREYERTSTVAINAYLQPLMGAYLNRLSAAGQSKLAPTEKQRPKTKDQSSGFSLRVMQSSGGSISAAAAATEPVRTILSGPSGGIVGALGRAAAGFKTSTFDMGGTSTDVAPCDRAEIGSPTRQSWLTAGCRVVMDIHRWAGGARLPGSTKADHCGSVPSPQVLIRAPPAMGDRCCRRSPTPMPSWAILAGVGCWAENSSSTKGGRMRR
jgi:N-methylhydantoinase A